MSNIDLVHAAYVQRKVQEAERRRWADVIKEEVEKIKGCNPTDQSKGCLLYTSDAADDQAPV